MTRTDLILERAKLLAQVELLGRLIAAADPGGPPPAAALAGAAKQRPSGESPRPRLQDDEKAFRLGVLLLGGATSCRHLADRSGIDYAAVTRLLQQWTDWFTRSGSGRATVWDLTAQGRREVQARREPEEAE